MCEIVIDCICSFLQVAEETEDGNTFVKFRRKLQTKDQGGDYCIMKVC